MNRRDGTVGVATIHIYDIKAEVWGDLASVLKLSPEESRRFFEFGEYASLEIEIGENLDIVGGRVLPVNR